MVVIILQYISGSNQHIVYLKLTQILYVNYISIKLEKLKSKKKKKIEVSHRRVIN